MGFKKIDPQYTFAPVRSSRPTGQADLALKDFIQLNIPTEFATQFNRINGSN